MGSNAYPVQGVAGLLVGMGAVLAGSYFDRVERDEMWGGLLESAEERAYEEGRAEGRAAGLAVCCEMTCKEDHNYAVGVFDAQQQACHCQDPRPVWKLK